MTNEKKVLKMGLLSLLVGGSIAAVNKGGGYGMLVGSLVLFIFIGGHPTYDMLKSWNKKHKEVSE